MRFGQIKALPKTDDFLKWVVLIWWKLVVQFVETAFDVLVVKWSVLNCGWLIFLGPRWSIFDPMLCHLAEKPFTNVVFLLCAVVCLVHNIRKQTRALWLNRLQLLYIFSTKVTASYQFLIPSLDFLTQNYAFAHFLSFVSFAWKILNRGSQMPDFLKSSPPWSFSKLMQSCWIVDTRLLLSSEEYRAKKVSPSDTGSISFS